MKPQIMLQYIFPRPTPIRRSYVYPKEKFSNLHFKPFWRCVNIRKLHILSILDQMKRSVDAEKTYPQLQFLGLFKCRQPIPRSVINSPHVHNACKISHGEWCESLGQGYFVPNAMSQDMYREKCKKNRFFSVGSILKYF